MNRILLISLVLSMAACAPKRSPNVDPALVGAWNFKSTTCQTNPVEWEILQINSDGTAQDMTHDSMNCDITDQLSVESASSSMRVTFYSSTPTNCPGYTPSTTVQTVALGYTATNLALTVTQSNGCSTTYAKK